MWSVVHGPDTLADMNSKRAERSCDAFRPQFWLENVVETSDAVGAADLDIVDDVPTTWRATISVRPAHRATPSFGLTHGNILLSKSRGHF